MDKCKCIENGVCIKVKESNKISRNLKIACIFDSFTEKCYEGICHFIHITPENWKDSMSENRPDVFFVESAWNGKNNSWKNIISSNKKKESQILKNIVKWCNKNNIPTVFWNKEDPVNYNVFLSNAKLFDYVFTSDENSVEQYKKDLNHNRVFTLYFGANPKINNPIKNNPIKNKSFFAGTYYRNKFNERKSDLKKLLNLAIECSQLHIYDRHYGKNNPLYEFPKQYNDYIQGYLEVDKMYETYKKYRIALNVNCVKDSPSMFSRRVYECLSSGTPVISTYSLGINKIFGGLVVSTDNEEELREEFFKLEDENYYYDKVVKGIREVLNNHTYEQRLVFILKIIGIEVISEVFKVAVIIKTDDMKEYEILKNKYENQNYKYKKLYLLTNNEKLKTLSESDNVKIIFIDKYKKNKIEKLFEEDYIGFLNLENNYGTYYIEDLVNSRLYTNANIVGKKSYYTKENKLINENMDFRYVDNVDFDKCIIRTKILRRKNISEILKYIEKNKIKNVNGIVFSIDKSNLICDNN